MQVLLHLHLLLLQLCTLLLERLDAGVGAWSARSHCRNRRCDDSRACVCRACDCHACVCRAYASNGAPEG